MISFGRSGAAAAFAVLLHLAVANGQTWTQLSPTTKAPDRGSSSRLVFDGTTGRVMLFGGYIGGCCEATAETWFWTGTNWQQSFPSTSPAKRANHAMAYDEQRRQVVLFGGRDVTSLDDTWVWDGTTWTKKTPATSPPARYNHVMAWDPVRQQTILYGGVDGLLSHSDTWAWDGTNWTKLAPATSPAFPLPIPKFLAWDSARQVLVLYGVPASRVGSPMPPSQVWTWNGATWTDVTPNTNGATYVTSGASHNGRIVAAVHDGSRGQSLTWNGTAWQLLATNVVPPEPVYSMAWDAVRDRTIAVAGPPGLLTTWSLDLGTGCSYPAGTAFSGGTKDMPAQGGMLSIDVGLPANCAWTATASQPWLTLTPQSGMGSSQIVATADRNPGIGPRTAAVLIAGRLTFINQSLPPCETSGALPASPFVVPNGCTSTYTYTAAAGEQITFGMLGQSWPQKSGATLTVWNAAKTTALVTNSVTQQIEGMVGLVPEPQQSTFTFPAAGTYIIEIAGTGSTGIGTRVEYLRTGNTCTPTITAYSTEGLATPAVYSAAKHGFEAPWFLVGLAPGCPNIPLTTGASWLSVEPATLAPGYTRWVRLSFEANFTAAARTTTLNAGPASVQITQAASTCQYSLISSWTAASRDRTTGQLTLTATAPNPGTTCPWTAASNAPWLQVYPLSGDGSQTVRYTVFPNFGTKPRTAALTIAGQTFTVTQAPATGTPTERYVRLLYFNFFGRLPTPAEIAFQATSGLSREQLALNFFNSQEFTSGGRFVAGLYVGLLNRDAEYGGWLFQRDALANGINAPHPLIGNFLNSQEFSLRYGSPSNADYVKLLYRQILLREPTTAELDFQTSVLTANPALRINMAYGFLLSPEFVTGTSPRVTGFLAYAGLLGRDPTPTEFQAARTTPLATLLATIVNSAEFNAILE